MSTPLRQINDLIYTLHEEMDINTQLDKLKVNSALMQLQRAFITLETAYHEIENSEINVTTH